MVKSGNEQLLPLRVAAGAVLVMFLWAICFPLIKVGLLDSPPIFFAALRAGLSGAVLLMTAHFLGQPAVKSPSDWGGITLVGLTATTIGFLGMFLGGADVSPGLATVISNVQPLFAAGLAWVFLNERLSMFQQMGMVAGFGGIVLIGLPNMTNSESQLFGLGLILFAALGIAVSNVALKRLAGRVDILRAMGWQLLIGGIPLTILGVLLEDFEQIVWSARFVATLVILSVFGTSVAFVIWFSLLRLASLNRLNVYTFLTPIFGLTMGITFFGEVLSSVQIAGIVLSILGIYAVSRPTATAGCTSLQAKAKSHGCP